MVDLEDEASPASSLTGVFATDYLALCKKNAVKPLALHKISHPLPPLPMPATPPPEREQPIAPQTPASNLLSNVDNDGNIIDPTLDADGNPLLDDGALGSQQRLGGGDFADHPAVSASTELLLLNDDPQSTPPATTGSRASLFGDLDAVDPASMAGGAGGSQLSLRDRGSEKVQQKYQRFKGEPKYKYTPSVLMEVDEAEEIYKVEVRGWKLPLGAVNVFAGCIPACGSITDLTLWNVGLTESTIPPLVTLVMISNVRNLNLDQNPLPPSEITVANASNAVPGAVVNSGNDHLWATLLSDDSPLKYLSLRGNRITDVGAAALGAALKGNRNLTILNLWDNRIEKEGAGSFAEALKLNQSLSSLSLGHNNIGDEGALKLAMSLSKYALAHEDIIARRKVADTDRIRKDLDEDSTAKKTKSSRVSAGGGGLRAGSSKPEDSSSKTKDAAQSSAANAAESSAANAALTGGVSGSTMNIKSTKKSTKDAKGGGGGAGKKEKEKESEAAAAEPVPTPAAKGGKAGKVGKTAGGAAEKGAAGGGKDGAGGAGSDKAGGGGAAGGAGAGAGGGGGAAGDKAGGAKGTPASKTEKKGAAASAAAGKGGKKAKSEEAKEEEVEEPEPTPATPEPMFEHNGQWFVWGNRALANLNIAYNGCTDATLKAFLDAVKEQDASAEQLNDGCVGLCRLNLKGNKFAEDHLALQDIYSIIYPRCRNRKLEWTGSAAKLSEAILQKSKTQAAPSGTGGALSGAQEGEEAAEIAAGEE